MGFSYDGFGFTTTVGINQVRATLTSPGVVKVEGLQKIEGVCGIYISFTKRSGIGNNDITQDLHRYAINVVNLEAVSIPNSLSLFIGESSDITPTLTPSQASTSYIWHSSDNSVATVSNTGSVVAIAPGKTKITCTTHNGKTSECEVTVKPILMQSLSISPNEITIDKNDSMTLEATIQPTNTTNKDLDWISSDEKKVIISPSGRILALGAGKAFVTAKSKDGSNLHADAVITVNGRNIQKIVLDQHSLALYETESFHLNTTIIPSDADNKELLWSSSNEAVASVSQDGTILALSYGSAIITAKSTDGSDVAATCDVLVIPNQASSIILDKTEVTLYPLESSQLIATILPATTADKTITWTSSDESVAIVSDNGNITAISAGMAIITAYCGNIKEECHVLVLDKEQLWLSIIVPHGTCALNVTDMEEIDLRIVPDKGYLIHSITLDGLECQHDNGELYLPKQQHSSTLNIVFEDDSTVRVDSLNKESGMLKVAVSDHVISVKGLLPNQNVYVYDVNGLLLDITTNNTFVLSNAGIYILRIGSKSFKLAIP